MIPLSTSTLSGVWAPLLLPLDEQQHIDYALLSEQLNRISEAGVHGVYSNGTAGEFYNQTEDEFDQVQGILAERCESVGLPFQIGISHPSPLTMRQRLERTLVLKPGAFQVILPDWLPPTMDENVAFLQEMEALAGGIPLVLYNPPHAKKCLSIADFAALKKAVPGLIGIKVADGNASWYASLRGQLPDVSVFIPGHHMATGILRGARGSYSNVAGLHPTATRRWFDLIASNPAEAIRIEHEILDFFEEYIAPLGRAGYSNPALDKLLCFMGDWCPISPLIRSPYRSAPMEEALRLRALARERLPAFFALA